MRRRVCASGAAARSSAPMLRHSCHGSTGRSHEPRTRCRRRRDMFADPLVEKLAAFVRSVGIGIERATLDRPTRFPGLDIANGAVLIDQARLIHPGNILHEAGHLAVHDPAKRNDPQIDPSGGEELSTLAWSYAAALHLGLDPVLV